MASHDIGKILEHYGGQVPHRSGQFVKVRCPFHGDRTPSASLNTAKQRFHCFVCGFDGDGIAVIRWQEGCSYADAVAKATEITGEGDGQIPGECPASDWLSPRAGNNRRDGNQVAAWRLFGA